MEHAGQQETFYAQVGGSEAFARLVDAFYVGVAADPVLRPMYPEDDLEPAKERLRLFLEQYWGGPNTYSQLYGHPRLRARHLPFPIDEDARDRWLTHMRAAVDSQGLPEHLRTRLWTYLEGAAQIMVNVAPERPDPEDRPSLLT